jgi:hypothetical protein
MKKRDTDPLNRQLVAGGFVVALVALVLGFLATAFIAPDRAELSAGERNAQSSTIGRTARTVGRLAARGRGSSGK